MCGRLREYEPSIFKGNPFPETNHIAIVRLATINKSHADGRQWCGLGLICGLVFVLATGEFPIVGRSLYQIPLNCYNFPAIDFKWALAWIETNVWTVSVHFSSFECVWHVFVFEMIDLMRRRVREALGALWMLSIAKIYLRWALCVFSWIPNRY